MALIFENDRIDERFVRIPHHVDYNFPVGNFTIEARVKTQTGGIILQRKSPDDPGKFHFRLTITSDGSIRSQISDGTHTVDQTFPANRIILPGRGPVSLKDGNWHRIGCSWMAGKHLVYVDGYPFPMEGEASGHLLDYKFDYPIFLGATYEDTAEQPDLFFTGEIDGIRIWDHKESSHLISERADKRLIGKEKNLVGYWPLDENKFIDHSGNDNSEAEICAVEIADPEFLPRHHGPYLKVFADLVQDYLHDKNSEDDAGKKISAYQVRVQLCTWQGNVYTGPVKIFADSEVTVHYRGREVQVDRKRSADLHSDANGTLTFNALAAEEQNMKLPVLRIWTDFMHEEERLFAYADDGLHHRMQEVSGEKLQQDSPEKPAVLPSSEGFAPDHANAVAHTMKKMLGNSVQHHIEKAPGQTVYFPFPSRSGHRHSAPTTLIPGREHKTGSARIEHGTDSHQPDRNMRTYQNPNSKTPLLAPRDEHWELKFSAQKTNGNLAGNLRPTHETFGKEEYERRLGNMTSQATVVMEADALNLWDWFVNAAHSVEKVLVKVAHEIKRDVERAMDFIEKTVSTTIRIAGKVFTFVVKQISKVTEFISGIFRQIGVAIGKVLNFLAELLNWDDIVNTKKVAKRFVETSFSHFKNGITHLENLEQKFFDRIKADAGKSIDKLIDSLDHEKVKTGFSGNSPAHRTPGVQHNWLQEKVMAHAHKGSFKKSVQFQTLENQLEKDILDLTDQIFDQNVFNGLETIWDELKKAIHNPNEALPHLFKALLLALKATVSTAINLVKALFSCLLKVIRSVADGIFSMLSSEIQIPFVSWVYEKFVGHDKLSLLDLGCLMVALPTTLVFKLFNGGKAPFTKEETDKIMQTDFLGIMRMMDKTQARTASGSMLKSIFGIMYEVSNGLAGGIELGKDLLEIMDMNEGKANQAIYSIRKFAEPFPSMGFLKGCSAQFSLSTILSLPGFLATCFSSPLKYESEQLHFGDAYEITQWCWSMLSHLIGSVTDLFSAIWTKLPKSTLYKIPSFLKDSFDKIETFAGPVFSFFCSIVDHVISTIVYIEESLKPNPDLTKITLAYVANFSGLFSGYFKWLGIPYLVEGTDGVSGVMLLVVDAGSRVTSGVLGFILSEY